MSMNWIDPSGGIPPNLLKHLHLVSNKKYPIYAHIQLDTIADWLLAAPAIVRGVDRGVDGVVWRFLDCPSDGTSMLVWQPPQMGTEFATDGYIWADAEMAYSSQTKGYVGHAYLRKPQCVTDNANPNVPPPDSSLWIVHYAQADPAHHLQSNRIPISPYVRAMMKEREYIQQHGHQLQRKEFMLHDRLNWPEIPLPGPHLAPQASAYPNNVISHLNRQQPGYVQQRAATVNQSPSSPPPAKRARQTPLHAEATYAEKKMDSNQDIYDAEDVSRGDFLDFLTPRDISGMRFKQHHQWVGEVFRSPYDTQYIVPGELGLGRKGELEVLTKQFFNAPTELSCCTADDVPATRVGRMEEGKAEEFTRMATDHIAELNAQIAKMKRQHARRMAKLAKGGEIRDAERMLRTANISTGEVQSNGPGNARSPHEGDDKVAAIRSKVEATLGKEIRSIKDAECMQRGGLQEKVDDNDHIGLDYDFGDQNADLSGQIPAFQTPQDQLSSVEHTPGVTAEPAATSTMAPESAENDGGTAAADVAMGQMQKAPHTADVESEEWVVVNKEADVNIEAPNEELPDLDAFTNDAAIGSNVGTPGEHITTTAADLPDFAAAAEGDLSTDFTGNEFTDGVDLGHLDTAGEALSGYGAEETMEMDADLGGFDESAFGDAFHSTMPETGEEDKTAGS
ncbi:MAG: hypothetical protein Q9207_000818 [Kuettlingeria erythrocarpa]